MALLKKISERDRYWVRNRQPYVEPTEEQKIRDEMLRQERRHRINRAGREFAAMLGTVEAMCPGAISRTKDMVKLGSIL